LQVDVIDSGIGIERERQDYLFIPFLELKVKQNLKNVKNQTIGMGLACAYSIFNELDGRI
jgi:K+-sensing histidine kinase KdpD